MVVVCVTFAWNTWARLWTPRLVCWDGRGVCYVCVEYVDAFVDTAPGLPGWLWCVLRLRGIRGRVCERRAWFAGMVVVCVYVCVVCVAFRGL